ncbi:beta strand repeat-containing protein, partial [Rhizobium rhizogenes]|nr:filamentous hemagglutinin [Rhizobium rhizogenes]
TDAAGGRITLGPTTTGTGNLTLAAAGLLSADTLLSAANLDASGANITADNISAHGNLTLDGASSISGQILGAGNVWISGQSLSAQTVVAGLDFDATNGAGGNIVLGQAGDLTVSMNGAVTAPTIQAAGVIDISGASVAADAITGHKDLTLSSTAAAGVDVTRQVLGGGSVDISGASIKAGTIVSGVDFARTAAANGNIVQTTSGDLTLASSGSLDAGTLLSAGDLSAAGSTISADSVTAHGDVALDGATGTTTASGRVDVSGQILGAGNVLITGQSLSAQTVVAGIDFDATNAAGGNIVLGQAGDLSVSVNGTVVAPTLQAAGVIDISGASVAADVITGHKGITLSGVTGGVDIDSQVLGGGDISVSGSSIKAGTIVSGVDFAATAAADGNIVLASSGDLNLASTGNINTATLLSAGDLKAAGSTVTANAVT